VVKAPKNFFRTEANFEFTTAEKEKTESGKPVDDRSEASFITASYHGPYMTFFPQIGSGSNCRMPSYNEHATGNLATRYAPQEGKSL